MASTPKTIGTSIDIRTLDVDESRKSFAIWNTHATAIVYLKEGSEVSADNGIPIYPKGNVSFNVLEDGDSIKGAWSTISDTASTLIIVFEGS